MKIETVALKTFRKITTNCYVLKSNNEIGIIDPGYDPHQSVMNFLEFLEGEIKWAIATHGHWDHILGAHKLTDTYGIPLIVDPADETYTTYESIEKSLKKHVLAIEGMTPPKPEFARLSEIKLGNSILVIMRTPGHTQGSISIYSDEAKVVFAGDVNIRRPYSKVKDIRNSIRKLQSLPEDTTVYPGHGEPTTLAKLTIL